jgi:hypothetical protein
VGDDVDPAHAITGLGLVRGIDLVSEVAVPKAVQNILGKVNATEAGVQLQRDDLHSAVNMYLRLVFRALLTARWAPPKAKPGAKASLGRYKFGIKGLVRPHYFDVDSALTGNARVVEVVDAYCDAVVARAFPAADSEGARQPCEGVAVGHGAGLGGPLWAPPCVDSAGSGSVKFGEAWGCAACVRVREVACHCHWVRQSARRACVRGMVRFPQQVTAAFGHLVTGMPVVFQRWIREGTDWE